MCKGAQEISFSLYSQVGELGSGRPCVEQSYLATHLGKGSHEQLVPHVASTLETRLRETSKVPQQNNAGSSLPKRQDHFFPPVRLDCIVL